ncbi:hypothetical protein BASA83_011462 [Batrachochytrium salamandrivorans]|nr:hypothetical protein BASA83_011462 [Batrachochytrium salamandrivorans]
MRYRQPRFVNCFHMYRPSSLVNLARLKYGASFSYFFAWRALQCHRQDINKGGRDIIWRKFRYFLHEIGIANPGPTTYVAATSGVFDNAFLCLGPMSNAVQSMSTNA